MRRVRGHRGRFVAAAVVLGLVAAACGNSGDSKDADTTLPPTTAPGATTTTADLTVNVPVDAPGVTDTEIQVTVITSKTNPIGGKYEQFADGVQLFFDKINAEGGIYGRELKIAKERDDFIGLKNQDEVHASLAEDNAFATFVATLQFTGAALLDEAGMPTFTWNINPEMAGHDNIFGSIGAICFDCTGHFLPWLAVHEGYTKVGILGYGISASSQLCAAGNRRSYEKYAPDVEVAFFDDTLEFAADMSAQVAEMKEKGVQLISTCFDANQVFKLQTEMDKQGLDAVQNLPNAYDHEFLAENGELFEGAFLEPQNVPWEQEPQSAATQEYLKWVEKQGVEPVELTQVGWIAALQFYEGLVLAGPEFSQQKVIDGLNTQTDFSADGLIVPIDWTKQHNDPAEDPSAAGRHECATVLRITGGKFVPTFNEPGKPWICFDPADDAPIPDEPESRSFAPEGEG